MQKLFLLVDPVVICPYNRSHLIARSRVQKHIVKCEKAYPDNYKALCPYDATHRVFKAELEDHILTCPMKKYSLPQMYPECDENFKLYSENSSTIACSENWDAEMDNELDALPYENLDNNSDIYQDIDFTHMSVTSLTNKSYDKDLRPPSGFSEAALKEVNESFIDDNESITSSMGVGRGKLLKTDEKSKVFGFGRGKPVI